MRGKDNAVWIVLAFIALLVLWFLLFIYPAHAHDAVIRKCNPQIKDLKLVLEEPYGNSGFYAEGYDRNGDGKLDILALSSIKHVTEHAEMPTYYITDLNLDGQPDVVFIDKTGVMNCDDIVAYSHIDVDGDKYAPKRGDVGL